MAVRGSVWREHGPFDDSYRFYGQDLDFCLRARDRGWSVRHLPDFRVLHHQGDDHAMGETVVTRTSASLE
jgi:GT2 family glycosyltransferase